jgi:hypothetical protein
MVQWRGKQTNGKWKIHAQNHERDDVNKIKKIDGKILSCDVSCC